MFGKHIPWSLNLHIKPAVQSAITRSPDGRTRTHHSRSLHSGFLSSDKKSSVFFDICPGGTGSAFS